MVVVVVVGGGGGWWWLVVMVCGWWLVAGGWWLLLLLLQLFLLLLLILVLWALFFLSLVVLAVTTVDAGSVWDIAFFDPKEVYLGVFLLFGTSPTRMLVISTDNNCNVEIAWAKASLSVCVHVLHWDDERRLLAVRLKTSSTRTRSYVTWPGKERKRVTRSLAKRPCCQERCGRRGGITY